MAENWDIFSGILVCLLMVVSKLILPKALTLPWG
ncbi:uncharacterized protein METZ01_LOCUS283967 [marine metagenome]|uniref:Uncharacterized protein n=1 Tax=marine metagenome TaxID=408172 RepID=A0A382L5E4_9ZZZZ